MKKRAMPAQRGGDVDAGWDGGGVGYEGFVGVEAGAGVGCVDGGVG